MQYLVDQVWSDPDSGVLIEASSLSHRIDKKTILLRVIVSGPNAFWDVPMRTHHDEQVRMGNTEVFAL